MFCCPLCYTYFTSFAVCGRGGLVATIEETLKQQGYVIHAVEGSSMLPMLEQANDLVKIVPLTRALHKGDLPLYKRPSGQYVLHRAISVKDDYFIACGDNTTFAERVPNDWVIGITQGFYKSGKYISCDDEQYLRYVRRRRRNRSLRCFLLKFTVFRALRKVRNYYRYKKWKKINNR